MSTIEFALSEDVSYGFEGGPQYDNTINRARNGKRRVRINWDNPLRRFRAIYSRFTPELYFELLSAFHVCHADAFNFLFKDWTDFEVGNEPLATIPTGTDPVQLTETYLFGGQSKVRNITRPIAASVVVEQYVSGVWTVKAGTVAPTTGLFTPSTAWGAGAIRWSGQFYVLVHFAGNYMPASYEDWNAVSFAIELEEENP